MQISTSYRDWENLTGELVAGPKIPVWLLLLLIALLFLVFLALAIGVRFLPWLSGLIS